MNENDARHLAALYTRRRTLQDMLGYARRSDVFREAAEKQFSGNGYNSSLREAVGGVDALGSVMKRAVLDDLELRLAETANEITKAGGEL